MKLAVSTLMLVRRGRRRASAAGRRGGVLAAALAAACAGLLTGTGTAASAQPAASALTVSAQPSARSHIVRTHREQVPLDRLGTVNLTALARAAARSRPSSRTMSATVAMKAPRVLTAPLLLPPAAALGSGPGVKGVTVNQSWAGNVRGAHGFNGLSSALSGVANSGPRGVGYVSPADPALAVGSSPKGVAVLELVNDALSIYTPSGTTLAGPVPAYKFFQLRASAQLSDPRANRNPVSGDWFVTESVVGDSPSSPPSAVYVAASQTTNPLGRWSIFRLVTSDGDATGCPCFADLTQLGSNADTLYISANQYSVATSAFIGTIIYDAWEPGLVQPARSTAPLPGVTAYRVPASGDSFGAYGLSPSLTVPGGPGNIAEYFVESDSNATTGSGLEIYALINEGTTAGPQLVETSVRTEPYSYPPSAIQRHGPTPYGCAHHHCATARLDPNFDAVQQVSIAPNLLYAELDTGIATGTGQQTGAAWFVLNITPGAKAVSVSLVSQGYVASTANILDPVIGVNHSGSGYLAFAAANANRFPSAAYVAFDGSSGPAGPVRLAAKGRDPLDDFTCYSKTSAGSCRFGDYSAAAYWGGRIYMATEYVPAGKRDTVSNWSTRIWYAPVP
jgi:hypothetical protein